MTTCHIWHNENNDINKIIQENTAQSSIFGSCACIALNLSYH